MKARIAVYGLGVMGRNIALNMADQGFTVAVHNRSPSLVDQILTEADSQHSIIPCYSVEDMLDSLQSPRVIFLMVTAGAVVDRIIEQLLPQLSSGDIIIDGGNSHFPDTERRYHSLKEKGIRFLGVGISGGEEGARHGPSIMPGGDPEAWPVVEDIFTAIAARAEDGQSCCRWIGEGGAGHYVKMIHNGIEYGDMQLIAESWQFLHQGLQCPMHEVAAIFARWNDGKLASYLIEITAQLLTINDVDGTPRVQQILDSAGQKGTGRWTALNSLELGIPLTLITESVYARSLSAFKQERLEAAEFIGQNTPEALKNPEPLIAALENALYAAKLISYAQGFLQMREAAQEYGWNLQFGEIALIWRAGCIIRSRFLNDIHRAYEEEPALQSLLFDRFFRDALCHSEADWRAVLQAAIAQQIPVPALSSALAFFDAYRSAHLPANLIQAQRDFFGAHTYHRLDQDADAVFHSHWGTDGREERVNE